jgi:hypothetical protein
MTKPKPDLPCDDSVLFIDLDVDGLAALLRTVEAALAEGRGVPRAGTGSGIAVRTGSDRRFGRVTVTAA